MPAPVYTGSNGGKDSFTITGGCVRSEINDGPTSGKVDQHCTTLYRYPGEPNYCQIIGIGGWGK